MADREKIISDLEWIHNALMDFQAIDPEDVVLRAIPDAIVLLKEHETVEQKTGHWIVLEYCANEGIYCSECHMKIFDRITKPKGKLSNYCPHCGSRNEQFFRDGEVVFR